MRKKSIVIYIIIIIALCIAVPVLAVTIGKETTVEADKMQQITVWQIDGFEGGKGSRAQYLQRSGEKCFKNEKIYFTVHSLTAEAARANFGRGVTPDLISYPAGFAGVESLINGRDFTYRTWCRGAYCILTTEETADFSDVSAENTVINAGKDNLSSVAAALCGLQTARYEQPTNAYLQLIGGKCKYLFGTQRDIFRLKARNAAFSVKPVTEFNDLYQNISILTTDGSKYESCLKFTDYIINNPNAGTLGLFDGSELCAEELKTLSDLQFDCVLNFPCAESYTNELKKTAENGDVNKLKTLLK